MVCVSPLTPLFRDTRLTPVFFLIGDQEDYYQQQGPGGPGPSTLRQPSGHYIDPTRSQHFDDRRPSPQPHGHSHLRPQSDFPTPGAARQTIWSQALENKDAPKENGPQRETFVQIEPSHTMTKAFALHGLLSAGMQDRQERSAKRQEEVAKETGASLVNVPMKPLPPQTGLLGAVSAHQRERKREGGIGAALTERERDRRMAEERQRKLDDFQKQQLEMVQNGSMYGSQFGPGFNPMMANPMMMGVNPMMGGWGYNPMMGNPQQMFAAQQAAAQAYQQAMMTFGQNMGQSQAGGEGLGGMSGGMGMGGSGMLNPMATGQQGLNPLMTGQFDPRMSMMGMPMMGMGMGMGMGPMNPMMTGQSGMGPGMGTGGGLAMQMTGGSSFDPRLSPQFDLGGSANPSPIQGSPSGSRPLDAPPPSRSPANASPAPK
jgi:CCR4-NOT transcriptional complex subunit CAF120